MSALAAFRTDELPAWNRRVAELLGALSVRAGSHDFHAALRHRGCGALAVSAFDSTAAGVDGGASGPGCFVLLNQAGESRVSQCGREAVLGPGDVTLLRREAPYRVAFARANRMLVLALPADPRCDLEASLARRIGGGAAAFDAGFSDLSHFCRSFQRRFGCSASPWRRRH